MIEQIACLTQKQDREFADSVLEVSMKSNGEVVKGLIGDDSMSNELLEIMKPLIEPIIIKRENEKMQQGFEQGLQQGIRQEIRRTINIMRSLGHNDIEIENIMKEQYTLTEEEIKRYMVI